MPCVRLLLLCSVLLAKPSAILSTPPVFSFDNPVVTLKETQSQQVDLATASCSDPDNGTVIVSWVSLSSSLPCTSCFGVYPNCNGGSAYCLRYLPGQGKLDFSQAPRYPISIYCQDSANERTTVTVEVRIEPNTPPYPALVYKTYTLSNAETVAPGTSVTSATCNDPDYDVLSYSMTSNPQSSLFTIGSTDGVIRTTGNMATECRSQIEFTVTCTDNINTVTGTSRVLLTLSGGNERPSISGINYSLNVKENTAVGTSLASFSVTDDDQTTCTLAAVPTESLQYFGISSSSVIDVRSTLDYEQATTRNTNLTVTCTDGFCTSYTAYLYVIVTDVNEPIVLYPRDFTLSSYEGKITHNPAWTPIDPDENDYPTYTIIGGNTKGHFAINPTTGVITSTLEYDVDQGAMPTTDTLIVQVKDVAAHTSTTTVTLTILDLNDNAPVFTQQSQEITITDCTTSLGVIGTVTATDKDSSFQGNNVITYSGTNGPITIGSSGSIIANTGITGGKTYTVSAVATDSGLVPGPLSSTPAPITVIVTTCPTTTTSTTTTTTTTSTAAPSTTTTTTVASVSANSKTSTTDNLAWIIVAGLLGTALLVALGYMGWRYCSQIASPGSDAAGSCWDRLCPRSKPTPRAVQVKPKGQQPRSGNTGFWQERYPDDDYVEQPIRDRTPTPAPIEGGGPLALTQEPWRPRAGF